MVKNIKAVFRKNCRPFFCSYFPHFLFLTLFLLLSGSFIFASLKNKTQLQNKAQESEELNEPKISEWVPIDLNWFNQTHDGEIKSLQLQLSSLNNNEVKKDVLYRSVQIYQIEKEEYNVMDENKDGKVDYQEFNKRTVEVYARTYPLKHQKIPGEQDGIYDSKLYLADQNYLNKLKTSVVNNNLMVIVEAGIYDQIRSSLEQYKTDVQLTSNYQVTFYLCNGCTKEQIKDLLRTPGVVGTLFVGDLPVAWFKGAYFGVEVFPIDLYFMDLDGSWGEVVSCGGQNTCFSVHNGSIQPELFIGRITVPVENDEIRLITNYFRKNHNFKLNGSFLSSRMLDYIDDSWVNSASYWLESTSLAYPVVDNINNQFVTNATDFKGRLDDDYEHLLLAAHSSPFHHTFMTPGGANTYVNYTDIESLKPHFYFYNLFACSNARFTEENYMAGWYVLQESDYGLLAVGSTKVGAMLDFDNYYLPLSRLEDFGSSFKNWFSYNVGNKAWFGGMTLIGDPTLKINPPVYPTLIPTPSPRSTLPAPKILDKGCAFTGNNLDGFIIYFAPLPGARSYVLGHCDHTADPDCNFAQEIEETERNGFLLRVIPDHWYGWWIYAKDANGIRGEQTVGDKWIRCEAFHGRASPTPSPRPIPTSTPALVFPAAPTNLRMFCGSGETSRYATFLWDKVEGAVVYHLVICDHTVDTNCLNPRVFSTTENNVGSYYIYLDHWYGWWVIPYDRKANKGNQATAADWFKCQPVYITSTPSPRPTSTPVLPTPTIPPAGFIPQPTNLSASSLANHVTFSWDRVERAYDYLIVLCNHTRYPNCENTESTSTSVNVNNFSYYPQSGAGWYGWWMYARDSSGNKSVPATASEWFYYQGVTGENPME